MRIIVHTETKNSIIAWCASERTWTKDKADATPECTANASLYGSERSYLE